MRIPNFSRYVLSITGGVVLIAGCAGPRPSISAPDAIPPAGVRAGVPVCGGSRIGHARCTLFMERSAEHLSKPEGWAPRDLQSAYSLPSAKRGTGQIVAVVDAFDNPDAASDLAEYRATFKLPKAKFTKYNQGGQTSNYPQGSPDWGLQIDLDVEMVSASCPNCTIYLLEANSTGWNDIEAAEAEAVTLGAHIISNSLSGKGADKSYFDTSSVTYLAATDGSGIQEPADFDSVVAVGDTVLSRGGNGSRGWSETIWTDSNEGGCSTSVRKPRWQHDQYCDGRLANDVAAVAVGVAEYDTYGYGGWITVDGGGGSATPFLAGVFGLAGNETKQRGGRTFWKASHQKYLYPVTGGGGSCAYNEGNYSSCTGWGSPHGIGAF